ncbi:S-methyl-5-thioribose kinase [Pseudoalteromonas byunsanensis]|uniref:Methylthioribose kinase n=1 Tax=Pseudoalteromonas byunsanensis TaxID=327939 RepID=A0A1S1NCJ5_9GAMM|nr:S-methyl-5-thioribose kinase [Pseudoalteromonas byunsanensis]OHU97516.1 S-methyl-5-thioribose kinase [Pseudoalteromonas byunsanensis]
MVDYIAFDSTQALEYVKNQTNFFAPDAELTCYEFGDGNLNLVFRIHDQQQHSVILKQALPYARCVGESWPLTLDRARIEASVLIRHGEVCAQTTVKVLHRNDTLAITVLEDLGHMHILRGQLCQGHTYPNLAIDVADYLAKTSFYHSDFYLSPAQKKALVKEFTNPELCAITEDLFFDDPYHRSERNNYPNELQPHVTALQNNSNLKLAVAELKAKFLSSPQSLLHGDVHTGSIFVDQTNTKLIDPEFGFFGPIGFDLGSFIGNLLLNYCAQHKRAVELPKRRDLHAYLLNSIQTCVAQFEKTWLQLAKTQTRDLALQAPGYAERFINQVLRDAYGFCGTELIRRTIGLAHVADIDGIENLRARVEVQQQTLLLGEQLILQAPQCDTKEDLSQLLLSLLL